MGVLVGLLICFVGLIGCQRLSPLDSIHAGHTRTFDPNVPQFDYEAYTAVRGEAAGVQMLVRIPVASLTFLAHTETRNATYEVVFRIWDPAKKRIQAEHTVEGELHNSELQSDVLLDEWHIVKPGRYLIEAELTDVHARRTQQRYQRVTVQSTVAEVPYLSRIQIAGSSLGEPTTAYPGIYVPTNLDSLQVRVSLGGIEVLLEPTIQMRLVRFRADTAHAVPPAWPRVTEQTSFRFAEADTLQTSVRTLSAETGVTTGVFYLPPLVAGAYRVQIMVEGRDARTRATHHLEQERFFASVHADFPEVTHLDQMTAALAYIADPGEWSTLQHAPPVEQKKLFDAFWGRHVRQRERAADLIERYYARVEEANRQFTTHKEGWKTDRGMVYIVMGPPLYVDQNIDREIWHYSYESPEQPSSFEFVRGYRYGLVNPFEAYALRRHIQYHQVWQRAVRRWREGRV